MVNTWIFLKTIGLKKNIKNHGLLFYYNIREDPLLGIDYVAYIWILCVCYECLRKLPSPWNISRAKYNKDQYKGENQNFVYWPILGPYKNWKIMHCIDSIKQQKSIDTVKGYTKNRIPSVKLL